MAYLRRGLRRRYRRDVRPSLIVAIKALMKIRVHRRAAYNVQLAPFSKHPDSNERLLEIIGMLRLKSQRPWQRYAQGQRADKQSSPTGYTDSIFSSPSRL